MSKRLRTESLSATTNGQESSKLPTMNPEHHQTKYASVEPDEMPSSSVMECLLPPHKPLSFSTYDSYESHYSQAHTNRCRNCKSNFPTSHLLDLHIAENHNPILASKKESGEKTFACFVEGCDKVCRDWKKRRSHLVDKHAYPKNYDFLVVDHGIDGRRSMLRPGIDSDGHRKSSRERRKSASAVSTSTETTEPASSEHNSTIATNEKADAISAEKESSNDPQSSENVGSGTVDELTSSMSALKMVPRSITFGKRKGRAGFAKS